ncbi:MAG: hypothetical protein IMF26_05090 [Candidatus Fermentithermobacillus carboniphilus]|uniref:Uncharacterized protein n=1 Tax=Candidatus Fermentithermobacillus carboniphilus TaxID=3085328 RepID=A0AAT9LEH6_9FIRM|nr:MAG: hypothetical protein IMF26_05090 [Candidatus Fermentithermobacillus carboniphilus]
MSTDPKVWLAALMSIGIYSYLYKENPIFRVCEHLYLGLSLAHLAVMGWTNVRDLGFKELGKGNVLVLIPMVLGVLLFMRFSPKNSWLSRYSLAYLMGVAGAVTITGVIDAGIISQIRGAITPLTSLDSVVALICNVTAITVFFFIIGSTSKTQQGKNWWFERLIRWSSTVGRFVLMISFGAVFGTTIMARLGLFIPRLRFLLGDWIHLIPSVK